MGTLCPVCLTHQPFVQHLTKDQGPALRATDVIGHKLGCGHLVGGESFNRFQEEKRAVEKKAADAIRRINEEVAEKLGVAWQRIQADKKKEVA